MLRTTGRSSACAGALAALAVVLFAPASSGAAAAGTRGLAYSIALTGEIDPPAARALDNAIDDARRREAALVIVRLDTPGGLIESTRAMVRTITAAAMPVIVYVPSGGRADSAGLILTLACDVAAMAPETNIGSATPVRVGPPARTASEDRLLQDLRRKATNGFVGFARSLAENHGRNAGLAERMVRDAENVSARTARREHLIDLLAPSEPALLRSLDGFAVKGPKAQRLATSTLQITRVDGAALADADVDLERSSFWRSFAYVFGAAAAVVLLVTAVRRAAPSWRRWRRKRRRVKLQRR